MLKSWEIEKVEYFKRKRIEDDETNLLRKKQIVFL